MRSSERCHPSAYTCCCRAPPNQPKYMRRLPASCNRRQVPDPEPQLSVATASAQGTCCSSFSKLQQRMTPRRPGRLVIRRLLRRPTRARARLPEAETTTIGHALAR